MSRKNPRNLAEVQRDMRRSLVEKIEEVVALFEARDFVFTRRTGLEEGETRFTSENPDTGRPLELDSFGDLTFCVDLDIGASAEVRINAASYTPEQLVRLYDELPEVLNSAFKNAGGVDE